MKHAYIDEYSGLESFIHGIEPRIKVLSTFTFILFVIFTKPEAFASFLLYALFLGILIFLSKIPFAYILKRFFALLPFVIVIAIFVPFFKSGRIVFWYSFFGLKLIITYDGFMLLWNCLIKASLSIISMTILTASTKFSDLLKALERLRFPSLFIMVISFMYRYIFVVTDELMIMKQAKESRSVRALWRTNIMALANMVGVLFIRAYERAENVYLAMCSRGFTGKINTLYDFSIKTKDICFLFIVICFLSIVKCLGAKNG